MAAIYAFGVLWLAVTLHWDRVDQWHHDNPVRPISLEQWMRENYEPFDFEKHGHLMIREDEHPVTFSEAYERNSNN